MISNIGSKTGVKDSFLYNLENLIIQFIKANLSKKNNYGKITLLI